MHSITYSEALRTLRNSPSPPQPNSSDWKDHVLWTSLQVTAYFAPQMRTPLDFFASYGPPYSSDVNFDSWRVGDNDRPQRWRTDRHCSPLPPHSLLTVHLEIFMSTVRTISHCCTLSDIFQKKMYGSDEPGVDPQAIHLPSLSTCLDTSLACPELSTSGQDDFMLVQVGGGRREPSPAPEMTPMQLRQKIKATTRDTGIVREASFRRSHLPLVEPSTEGIQNADDVNPFLSEPVNQTASKTDTSLTSKSLNFFEWYLLLNHMDLAADGDETPRGPAVQKPVPAVNPLNTLTRASSNAPPDLSLPSLRPSNTLAVETPKTVTHTRSSVPPEALDKFVFEPVEGIYNPKSKVGL